MAYSIIGPLQGQGTQLPFFSHLVPAGFPSPAADHLEKHISLDELFEIRAPHVYLVKIEGESMMAALNTEPMCECLNRVGKQGILTSEKAKQLYEVQVPESRCSINAHIGDCYAYLSELHMHAMYGMLCNIGAKG
jgi:hypothetical protein